jgi:hypothetical protein
MYSLQKLHSFFWTHDFKNIPDCSNNNWKGLGLVLTVVSNARAQYQMGVVEVSVGGEVIVTDGG